MYPIEFYNYWLALGTILMQLLGVALLVLFFLRKNPQLSDNARLIGRWGLWAGFVLTIVATALTLFYSEVLGIAPCGWCWVQRVFLWPQIILFGIALWRNERSIADYSIVFSVLGGIVALYQHYLQMGGTALVGCPASGTLDCAQRFLFEFNYITFPLMSATLFGFLIVVMLFVRQRS